MLQKMRWRMTMLRMMVSRGRTRMMLKMMMWRRRKMMTLRRRRRRKKRRRRRTDHKTPECAHTVWETHVAPGIVRGQLD